MAGNASAILHCFVRRRGPLTDNVRVSNAFRAAYPGSIYRRHTINVAVGLAFWRNGLAHVSWLGSCPRFMGNSFPAHDLVGLSPHLGRTKSKAT